MTAETPAGWHRTSPLAAVFYLGRTWQLLARNALQSLAPLAAFMVAFGGDPIARLGLGASLFALVTVVIAVARYLAFRYSITEHAILIRDGVFHKKQLDIRYERVQAVNTTRGPLDRLFGLVNVSFDTAGSSGEEGQLPAVPIELAERLRERIDRTPKISAGAESAAEPERRNLLRLGAVDMVRIGVSSGRVFLVLAVLGPLSEALDLELHERLEETALMEALGAGERWGMPAPLLWAAAAAALVAVLFSAAVLAAFLRHHRYALSADAQVLRSTGGLLTRHEHAVDKKKIQLLVATQNPVLRLFRRYRLRMRQAASGRGGGKTFIVPLCAPDTLPAIEREVFADEFLQLTLDPRAAAFCRISPCYLRSRILLFGVVPALAASSFLFPLLGPAAGAAFLWVPVAGAAVYQAWRRLGVWVTPDGVALRSGFAGFRISAHLHRKVQKVTLHQSSFQRRRGLATLQFYLAAGSVSVPFIEQANARRLRDYVLWRLETDTRPWH